MATTSCLICYDPVICPVEDEDEVPEDLTVFTLRCLLQVDKHQQQDKVTEVIRLCEACRKGVEQAQAIYNDLLEIGKKFRGKQKETVDKIRTSGVSSSPARRRSRRKICGNMLEGIRQCVLELDLEGPLIIQDWRSSVATSAIDRVSVVVKQEVELSDPNESDGNEMAFPHVSEEAPEVKSEPESEDSCEESEKEENVDNEDEAMEESLASEESDNGDEDNAKEMERDSSSASSKKVPSRKRKHNPPQEKRIKCRKRFLHSLEDPKNDDETRRMFGRIRCPFCELQGPNNTRNISLHVRNAHASDLNKYRKDEIRGGFPCCGKSFLNWILLWEHLAEKHEKKPLYVCDLCPEEFCTAFALRCHALKAHNHKEPARRMRHCIKTGITCQICGDLVKGKRALDHHMKQHQPSEALDESLRCPHCGLLKKWTAKGLHIHMNVLHGVKFKKGWNPKEYPCSEPNATRLTHAGKI